MNTEVMFSSKTDAWATPADFYQKLNSEFHFDLDPCADEYNHKCDLYFDKNTNGLLQSWGGHNVFVNPPYGREIGNWVGKSFQNKRRTRKSCGDVNFQPEPTQNGSTNIFTIKRKFVSFAED